MAEHDHLEYRVASDGDRLVCRRTRPDGVPAGWIVVLHGIQSHSGWYGFTREGLARAGWDARFPDRRGSGLSNFTRGHAPHWHRLVADVVHFLNDARRERDRLRPDAPVILGGLSWGGKLAYAVAQLRPELIDGLLLLYPGILTRIGPSPFQRVQLALAQRLAIRHRKVRVPLSDPSLFTSVPRWQEFIRDDPLALHEVTTGFLFASECLDHVCRSRPRGNSPLHSTNRSAANGGRTPLLLMLAGEDRIVDNGKVTELLAQQAGDALATVTFPSAQHTLEFEPCRDEYLAALTSWLSQRRPLSCDGVSLPPFV